MTPPRCGLTTIGPDFPATTVAFYDRERKLAKIELGHRPLLAVAGSSEPIRFDLATGSRLGGEMRDLCPALSRRLQP